jgi:formylglycine-generating enzyme required for sulfatase activity
MKLSALTLLVLIIATSSLFAQESFSLSGTVLNIPGEPVAGADVRLQNGGLETKSGTDGAFSLTGVPSGILPMHRSLQSSLTIHKNGVLRFSPAPVSQRISVDVFTMNGTRISSQTFSSLGNTQVILSPADYFPDNLSDRLYLVRIDNDGTEYELMVMALNGVFSTPESFASLPQSLLKNAAVNDTLLISLNTSPAKKIPIDNYSIALGDIYHCGTGMVLIPSKDSSFQMGSNHADAQENEKPVHKVSFTYDFWIDTTEVTIGHMETVMKEKWDPRVPWDKNSPDYPGKEAKHPAWYLNQYDCFLYCNELSKREGLDTVYEYSKEEHYGSMTFKPILYDCKVNFKADGYRLPTEAEWEYACRAGSTTEFYWGDDASEATVKQYAVYNTKMSTQTEYVASLKPNAFGLYDMSGNISERVHDWMGAYTADDQIDPIGPMKGVPESFVIKGGGFRHPSAKFLRSAIRWCSDNNKTGGHEERHHSHGPYEDKYCRPGFRVSRGLIPGKDVQELKPDVMRM